MPVAKGKKKTKRERRRFGSASSTAVEVDAPAPPARASRPTRRRGWQGPLWLNVTLGVIMIVGGVIFTAINSAGGFFVLVAYWAVGGFYLYRAYRQYQEKRATQRQ
jgi:hypothetical protein